MKMHMHLSFIALVYALLLGVLSSSKFGCGSIVGDYCNRSCIESEKRSLLLLKESLVDDFNYLSSWIGDDYCAWHGIACNNRTGHVIQINLRNGRFKVAGESLKKVLSSGLREEMDKALKLLARNAAAARQGSGSAPVSTEEKIGVSEVVIDLGDASGSGSKCGRCDVIANRRSVARRVDDPSRYGAGKTLTMTGIPKTPLPPVLHPEVPLHIEVHPHEHWTAGTNVPLQVFQGFKLPQDFGSYADRSRGDIADRCLSRGGRKFLSDFLHIVESYRADAGFNPGEEVRAELVAAKENVVRMEGKLADAEKQGEELARVNSQRLTEISKLEKDNEELDARVKTLLAELDCCKASIVESRDRTDILRKEVDGLKGKASGLEVEVAGLRVEVENGVVDVAAAIGVGYNNCYERLSAAGVDLKGHSFDDYRDGLATEMNETGEGNDV